MAGPPLHQHSPSELKEQLEAERRGAAFLVYRDSEGAQRILDTADVDRFTIGRSSASDLCIAWDADVSRAHATLERVGEQWTLIDDGVSRNGSFVNSERVQGRRRLVNGDRLRFGATVVTFRDPATTRGETTHESQSELAVPTLTDAQRRVLVALARPCGGASMFARPASNQEIADELFLSIPGVKTHIRSLFEKFGVEDLPQNQKRARLVELALHSGAITERDLT